MAKQQAGSGKSLNVLFFGSRKRDRDYLYGNQLEAWAQQGSITLHTAFSREQVCCMALPTHTSFLTDTILV